MYTYVSKFIHIYIYIHTHTHTHTAYSTQYVHVDILKLDMFLMEKADLLAHLAFSSIESSVALL